MKWLRRFLLKVLNDRNSVEPALAAYSPQVSIDDNPSPDSMRIDINRATNGFVIQVRSYKPVSKGPDWTGETLIANNSAEVMDAIKTGITTRMLSR